jgi:hypothetical protein
METFFQLFLPLGLTKKVFQGLFIRTPIGEQIQIFDSQRRMSDFLVSPFAPLSRRDKKTGGPCPVRDKMLVENAGCTSNPVPSGTECGDNHIAYLTARGKSVAVNFSTNILSRRDRKTFTCYLFHITYL